MGMPKIDSHSQSLRYSLEKLMTDSLYKPKQKWVIFSRKDAILAAMLDVINENIRALCQEHERRSREVNIHRHHLVQMQSIL
jgi:hypothetical protein